MTVTPAATEQLDKLLQPGEYLQIGLSSGGCGGATILLERVDGKTSTGSSMPVIGADNILWDGPTSARFLIGGTLDIDPSIFNAGFIVIPPQGTQSCGCGASIKLEEPK